jgi:protein-S-isoprenylcysteine O-methyltransferase Ste14
MSHDIYPKALVFLQFTIIGVMVLCSKNFLSSILSISIFFIGLLFGIWAINHNKLGNFNIQPKLKEGSRLITSGIYAYIRHPMYSSVIIMMLAFLISTPTLLEGFLFIALIFVLILKAKREESLWLEHNEAYRYYKESTKLFIPYIL